MSDWRSEGSTQPTSSKTISNGVARHNVACTDFLRFSLVSALVSALVPLYRESRSGMADPTAYGTGLLFVGGLTTLDWIAGLPSFQIRYAFFSYGVFFRHRVMDLRE